MKKTNKTERINILITPEEKEIMQKYCNEKDITLSQLVRWAVKVYMKENN